MNNQQNIAIEAATDGACSGNPGNGGWGALILFQDGSKMEIGGSEKNTTNNRMELTAAIRTLEKLKDFKIKKDFKLRTDSKYLIEGYTNWIKNWKKNNWKSSTGKIVLNKDLWMEIDELRIPGLIMEFVKGHSGDPSNERADLIATSFSKGIRTNLKQKTFIENKKIDKAPKRIENLFNRIELINKFYEKKYLLKTNELAELLDISDSDALSKYQKFEWRNWQLIPVDNKYWKIMLNQKDEHLYD